MNLPVRGACGAKSTFGRLGIMLSKFLMYRMSGEPWVGEFQFLLQRLNLEKVPDQFG